MTREEAIKVLQSTYEDFCQYDNPDDYYVKVLEAKNMAIEALQTETCEDAISRQEAKKRIKAICERYNMNYVEKYMRYNGTSGYAFGHAFDDLPSVKPILKESQENFNKDTNDKSILTEDLISRQVVVRLIDDWKEAFIESRHLESAGDISLVKNDFTKLPSVTPQKPRKSYLSIDDVMSVFDDFMCGEVDEDGTETFLEMLKDKAEIES